MLTELLQLYFFSLLLV